MSNYNSTNTKVLATHEDGGNKRMLLLHEMGNGRIEYVIGSYFTAVASLPNGEVREDGSLYDKETGTAEFGFASKDAFDAFWRSAVKDYSWDWGHYFGSVVEAVGYWQEEVLGTSNGSIER